MTLFRQPMLLRPSACAKWAVTAAREVPQVNDGGAFLKTSVGTEQRLALQLLASIPFGITETVMFTQGFTRRTPADFVHTGLQQ